MKKIISLYLQGLLYLAPISLTFYILYLSFVLIDEFVQELILDMFGLDIFGVGFILISLILIITGYLGQTILAQPFKFLLSRVIDRIPFLNFIYSALNDLFSAFVGKERKFNKPVLVRLHPENSTLEKLGFLTEDDLSLLGEKDKVAVYFPHSYNFSGELFIVPREFVKTVSLPPSDVMKFIVSAGVTDLD
jgi:uncharacterized membrane protein